MSASAWSRLSLIGTYTLESPLRVGTASGELVLDSNNQPLIPGSTIRGALRTYIESALRGIANTGHNVQRTITLRGADGRNVQLLRTVAICCDSVDKRDDDQNYQGCLTPAIVKKWESDPVLRPTLDTALIDCTCNVCRLFGASWMAGRVYIPDMRLASGELEPVLQTRGGIAISREKDIKLKGREYQRQSVPSGTRFSFQLIVENATPEEQGIILLGLRGLINGWLAVGADRSHGFGRGRLVLDWTNSRIMDIASLFGTQTPDRAFTEDDAEQGLLDLARWLGLTLPVVPQEDSEELEGDQGRASDPPDEGLDNAPDDI